MSGRGRSMVTLSSFNIGALVWKIMLMDTPAQYRYQRIAAAQNSKEKRSGIGAPGQAHSLDMHTVRGGGGKGMNTWDGRTSEIRHTSADEARPSLDPCKQAAANRHHAWIPLTTQSNGQGHAPRSPRYQVSSPPGAVRAAQARTSGNAKGTRGTPQGMPMSRCWDAACEHTHTRSTCHIRSSVAVAESTVWCPQ